MLEYLDNDVSLDYERVQKHLKDEEKREEEEEFNHEPLNSSDSSKSYPEDEESCSDFENEIENLVISSSLVILILILKIKFN